VKLYPDLLRECGLDLSRLKMSVKGTRQYRANRAAFLQQASSAQGEFLVAGSYPCLNDRFASGGIATGHYFHTDLHVARLIHSRRPSRHVDVGSRVDGFVAHVAVTTPIEVLDIRPLSTTAAGITFTRRDIMVSDPAFDDYCDSLSCLHALEHFGLGRYGDAVDYYGYRTGWRNLTRMVRTGGTFYFAVPISRTQRIEFDAHRVFGLPYIVSELVGERFEVASFAYVDDAGDLHTDVNTRDAAAQRSFDLEYGCGIFELVRVR
jgi:hypothetical protein